MGFGSALAKISNAGATIEKSGIPDAAGTAIKNMPPKSVLESTETSAKLLKTTSSSGTSAFSAIGKLAAKNPKVATVLVGTTAATTGLIVYSVVRKIDLESVPYTVFSYDTYTRVLKFTPAKELCAKDRVTFVSDGTQVQIEQAIREGEVVLVKNTAKISAGKTFVYSGDILNAMTQTAKDLADEAVEVAKDVLDKATGSIADSLFDGLGLKLDFERDLGNIISFLVWIFLVFLAFTPFVSWLLPGLFKAALIVFPAIYFTVWYALLPEKDEFTVEEPKKYPCGKACSRSSNVVQAKF